MPLSNAPLYRLFDLRFDFFYIGPQPPTMRIILADTCTLVYCSCITNSAFFNSLLMVSSVVFYLFFFIPPGA